MRAGGYMVEEAWERALRSAVAGLDLAPLQGLPSKLVPPSDSDIVMTVA